MQITKKQLKEMVRRAVKKQINETYFSSNPKVEAMNMLDVLKEELTAEYLLEELAKALPAEDLLENLKFIARMHDIKSGNEEE